MSALWPLACGALALATSGIVPQLPAPSTDEDEPPVDYRDLAGWRLPAVATALALLAGTAAGQALPTHLLPACLGLAGAGATLAVVDWRTTYLPQPLMRTCWALTALGACAAIALDAQPGPLALRLVVAAVVTAALLWLFWRLGGLGWGDVRLAPVVGAVGALDGWQAWYQSLLLGTVAGALAGVVLTLWRRTHPSRFGSAFAYGPFLWLGPWLAMALYR